MAEEKNDRERWKEDERNQEISSKLGLVALGVDEEEIPLRLKSLSHRGFKNTWGCRGSSAPL